MPIFNPPASDAPIVDHGSTGATETIDVTQGDWHRLTLDADCAITVSGFSVDKAVSVMVKVTQDGTGGRAITWDADVDFIGSGAPDQTASAVTYFLLWSDAGDSLIYGVRVGTAALGAIPTAFYRRTAGDYTLNNNSSFTAIDSTNLNLTVPAIAGDILEITLHSRYGAEAVNAFIDAATIVSGSAVNYVSGGSGSSSNFGVAGWVGLSGDQNTPGGSAYYTVQSGDLSGGNVTIRFMYRTGSAGNKTLRAGTASFDALFVAVKNLGQ